MFATDSNPFSSLKVGYVLKRFPRFSETFILNEILELERQGMEVEIFSLLRPPPEPRHELLRKLKAPVTYLPRGNALNSWSVSSNCASGEKTNIKELFKHDALPFSEIFNGKDTAEISQLCLQATTLAMIVSARNITHLHAHFASNATTVALMTSRLAQVPFSFTAHARDIYHTYHDSVSDDALRRYKISQARFVTTVSDFNRNHLRQIAKPLANEHIHRLYNGIDLKRFKPRPRRKTSKLFVAVGRLVEKKGFPFLIDACAALADRGHDFHCRIIGDGPDYDPLSRQIRQQGLEAYVTLVGAKTQEQVIRILHQAAAVVLPCIVSQSGDRDGLPTVLLEGMAMGLPVISTRVAGIPEIIDHERTGFLVVPNNAAALGDAMEQLINHPERQLVMGSAARHRAERLFDLSKNVAMLNEYFSRPVAGDLKHDKQMQHANRIYHCG